MTFKLRLSLGINVLLAGALLWVGAKNHLTPSGTRLGAPVVGEPAFGRPADSAELNRKTPPLSARRESPEPTPERFRWSQLESSDYRTYIANLRSVGCPEQTIRDIISADVDSLYATRREQFEKAVSQEKLKTLRDEEAFVIASLLGSSGPPALELRTRTGQGEPTSLSVPLVFHDTERTSRLTEQQLQVIQALRQRFQAEVGAQPQDTLDPNYKQRWEAARRDTDDLLQAMLGSEFYLEQELQASQRNPEP